MSKQRMDQNWQRMKEQILATWADVNEAELKKARGSLGDTVSLIHTVTGEDRQTILRKVSSFL